MDKFVSCLNCGNCCKSLIKEIGSIHQGIFLFLDEAEKLVYIGKQKGIKVKIFPKDGVSKANAKKPDTVYSFQFENDPCPFFNKKNNLCSIYENRPAACRAYPVMRDYPLTLDYHCSLMKALINDCFKNTHSLTFFEATFEARIIGDWIRYHANCRNVDLLWSFDLKTKTWTSTPK